MTTTNDELKTIREEFEEEIKKILGVTQKSTRTYKTSDYTLVNGTKIRGRTYTARIPANNKVSRLINLFDIYVRRLLDEEGKRIIQGLKEESTHYIKGIHCVGCGERDCKGANIRFRCNDALILRLEGGGEKA